MIRVIGGRYDGNTYIPALGRVRQEDHKLEVNLDYIVRSCLKKKI
jgi:hypothetical protein